MEKTLLVLKDLESSGIISRYAIGGAMGATFYAEPMLTFDLDVFLILPETTGGILTLAPLYAALSERGYSAVGECVIVDGVPVQFLPAYNALLEEALDQAKEQVYGKTVTRVMRAEHLVAIALQTGRDKDRDRVRILREQAELDIPFLMDVLVRHGLDGKWKQLTN
jgi:hypothetical protein